MKPQIRVNQITTTEITFVDVLKVTIGKPSRLCEIELKSATDDKTEWHVAFSPTSYEKFQCVTPKKFTFPLEAKLKSGDEILIQARSTDATSITVDAHVSLLEED